MRSGVWRDPPKGLGCFPASLNATLTTIPDHGGEHRFNFRAHALTSVIHHADDGGACDPWIWVRQPSFNVDFGLRTMLADEADGLNLDPGLRIPDHLCHPRN